MQVATGVRWFATVLLATASVMTIERALATQLDDLLRRKGFQTTDTVVPVLLQTVARAADFPTAASGPDFVYEYRPETGTFERSTRPFSPVLVEAARTVGRHVLQIGASFLWSDFNRLDGALLRNTRPTFSFVTPPLTPTGPPRPIPGALTFDRFGIEDFVFSGLVTYGVTERWDVGLVVPGVATTLRVTGQSQVRVEKETIPLNRFDIDDSKLGVGDIILRTKYVFEPGGGMTIAPTFALRMPSGNQDNF